jgi:membrane peptidoglycan carboxypeptidase
MTSHPEPVKEYLASFLGLIKTWRGVYPDFVRGQGRYGKSKAVATLMAAGLAAGLLSAAVALPVLTPAGIATRDAATTFDHMPVAGLGRLPARSEIVDAHGHLIAYYYPRGIYRVPVTFQQIAPVMRRAIIAIEDSRYYQHGALDFRGTIRALATTLSGQTQGGSDIAQQYVKNACLLTATSLVEAAQCRAETVVRKLRELRIAANVINHMTRHQLLAAYLNAVYFENHSYGIQVASRFYFSVPASKLTLDQSATLAGIVRNPYAYNPLQFPHASRDRRNVVLARMAQLGYITNATAERAAGQPLGLHISSIPLQTGCISQAARNAAFFCDYVLAVMRHDPFYAKAWAELNFTGGMTIHTTMGTQDQRAAAHAVNFVEPAHSGYYNPGHNADTEVLIQPGTGYVRAIAVNRRFGGTGYGHTNVDYAVNTRYGASAGVQTGSSSKVFTLVTALKQGLPFGYHLKVTSPTTVSPFYNCHGGLDQPFPVINAEGRQGPATYTIYQGTVASINAFYATLEQRVGLCDVVRTAVSMGMTRADGTSLLRRDPHLRNGRLSEDNYPSFTLGSAYVSPMNMAAAYATLAARGVYCRPIAIRAISGSDGRPLPVERARCHRAMARGVADAANYVLQGVLGPGGTADGRGIGIPVAAKTGTADKGHYAAFAGYTPRLAGYVSVFNPVAPTGSGAMIYPRADYREVDGLLSAPGQMFGDNAPAATWQLTFMALHLPPKAFVYPPTDPYFRLPLIYKPPKKHTHSPSPSPTPSPTATPIPSPTPSPTPTPTSSPDLTQTRRRHRTYDP